MLKVALLLPHLQIGGVSRLASDLSFKIVEEAECFIFLLSELVEQEHAGTVVNLDVTQHRDPSDSNILASYEQRAERIRRVKFALDIDVTVSFTTDTHLLNILSRARDRVVLSIHSFLSLARSEKRGPQDSQLDELIRSLFPRADRILVLTVRMKNDIVESFGIPACLVQVVSGFINVARVRQSASDEAEYLRDVFGKVPTIVSVGALRGVKCHRLLIQAFVRVRQTHPNANLVIIGDGPRKRELASQIDALGLRLCVRLLGARRNPSPYVAHASVFALPSVREAFPLVILEALCLGTPVVAADCPSGPREILTGVNNVPSFGRGIEICMHGVLVQLADTSVDYSQRNDVIEERWANAISLLLNDASLRNSLVRTGSARAAQLDVGVVWPFWKREIFSSEVNS